MARPTLYMNGKRIDTLEDLHNNFNPDQMLALYRSGRLIKWVEDIEDFGVKNKLASINSSEKGYDDEKLLSELMRVFEFNDEQISSALEQFKETKANENVLSQEIHPDEKTMSASSSTCMTEEKILGDIADCNKTDQEISNVESIKMTEKETQKVRKEYEDKSSSMTLDDLNKVSGKKEKVFALFKKLGKKSDALKLLWNLIMDYKSGQYKNVPWKFIASVVFAFVYLISPFDVIPDVIPVLGLTDDLSVFGFVIASFASEIEKYKIWKNNLIDNDSSQTVIKEKDNES